MEATQIQLAGLWIALMFTYLLGDVLRIFSGDFVAGEIDGKKATQAMWMGAALIMLIPILMILVSLTVDQGVSRWANIIAAGGLFLFNGVSIGGYPSLYDKFLLAVGLVFNVITVIHAWGWG